MDGCVDKCLMEFFSILGSPPQSILAGTYQGIVGDGCIPYGSGDKICANIGEQVTFSCHSGGFSYTIGFLVGGSINVLSTNSPAMITVTSNDFGTYICTVSNVCGNRTSTLILEPATCKSKCILYFRNIFFNCGIIDYYSYEYFSSKIFAYKSQ